MIWLIAMPISLILIMVMGICNNVTHIFSSMPDGVHALLVRTAALDEYFIFIILTDIGLTSISSMAKLSNHVILTLDIIYNLSVLFLILYNKLKEPESLPFCFI